MIDYEIRLERCKREDTKELVIHGDDIEKRLNDFDCDHEYTYQSGFSCHKCGHNRFPDGGLTE